MPLPLLNQLFLLVKLECWAQFPCEQENWFLPEPASGAEHVEKDVARWLLLTSFAVLPRPAFPSFDTTDFSPPLNTGGEFDAGASPAAWCAFG